MTDTVLLKEKINESGKRLNFLAEKCGLSRQSLSYKINGQREFTADEIKILSHEIGISNEIRDHIFLS